MFFLVGGFIPNWKYMFFVKMEIISPQSQDNSGISYLDPSCPFHGIFPPNGPLWGLRRTTKPVLEMWIYMYPGNLRKTINSLIFQRSSDSSKSSIYFIFISYQIPLVYSTLLRPLLQKLLWINILRECPLERFRNGLENRAHSSGFVGIRP